MRNIFVYSATEFVKTNHKRDGSLIYSHSKILKTFKCIRLSLSKV